MYKKRIFNISICVYFILVLHLPLISLSQSTTSSVSNQLAQKALSLVEIPDYGKQTRKLINDIELRTKDTKTFDEVSLGIDDILNVLDQKTALLSDTINQFDIDRLEKEERELSLVNQRIIQWKTAIQEINRDSQSKDSSAKVLLNAWQLTLDSISYGKSQTSESPNDLKTEILNFISDLTASQSSLRSYLDSIQTAQTELTIAENKLGNISNLIESDKTKLTKSIWVSDAPPIWSVPKDTLDISKADKLEYFVDSNLNMVQAFFKNNPKLPYYSLISFLCVLGIILYLKSKAKNLYEGLQEEFQEANIVLSYPLIATLIIFWFLSLFFTFFPKELNDVLSFFMLIPLVILLKTLNSDWKWHTVIIFSCSYLVFLLIRDIDYTFMGQRIFLIIINVLLLLLFVYYRKNKESLEQANKFWYGTLPFFINLFIIIGIVALLASVFGNIQLARLLNYIMLGVVITIHTIRAVVRLVRNFVFLILMGPLMKHSYILKEDGVIVLKVMDKLFRIIGFSALVYIVLEMLTIRKDTFSALVGIVNYEVSIGQFSLSLGNILAFILTLQIAIWLSSFIRYFLDKEVFPRSNFKQGVPNTILLMIKFTFAILGILIAFSAAGIQIDKLAIVMGALGVGIGFGLQNIFSNFISGIILAIERPISIGDLIEIPDVSGVVKDIGLRASTVRTWDGSDVIVPNGVLIANKLTNWTFFDRLRRVKVDIRVPFDANIEEVSILLLDTANKIPEVMKKPKAYLNFKGIGTSAMEITLYCWINDSNKIFSYGTAIRKAIYKALLEAGYDTPVPKQELKLAANKTR